MYIHTYVHKWRICGEYISGEFVVTSRPFTFVDRLSPHNFSLNQFYQLRQSIRIEFARKIVDRMCHCRERYIWIEFERKIFNQLRQCRERYIWIKFERKIFNQTCRCRERYIWIEFDRKSFSQTRRCRKRYILMANKISMHQGC
jgi:hypothetical protein